ncbi:unnamed protein product, partial [Scytosiphon promiscuus]
RAELGGKAAGRRVHGMVSRRIYGGPMEQAGGPEGGEQDGRASMSHKTKSTEDYSIDDWGADFVGGIVLTPKTGGPGSMWGRAQEALQEGDEDTDDSCAAAFDGSPPQQEGVSATNASFGEDRGEEGEGDFVAPSPLPTKASPGHLSDDQSAWSAPEFSLEIPGRSGVVSVGSSRGHRRTYAMSAVRRIATTSRHGVIPLGVIARRATAEFEDDEDDDDDDDDDDDVDDDGGDDDDDDDDDDGDGDAAVEEASSAAGKGDVGGESSVGEGGKQDSGEGKREALPKPKRRRSRIRRRRTRGFQTISKEDYTPMYVSTARFNVKKNRWESVDGYAVDIGTMKASGARGRGGLRLKCLCERREMVAFQDKGLSSRNGCLSGLSNHRGGVFLFRCPLLVESLGCTLYNSLPACSRSGTECGTSMTSSTGTCTGTPSSQERRRRVTSTSEDRLAAFQLGPKTLQHLAKSEQDHDRAMTRFLGEQGYARAKREGAARLRRLPGVAEVTDGEASDAPHPSKRKPAKRGSRGSTDSSRGSGDAKGGSSGGGGSSSARGKGKSKTAAAAGGGGGGDHRTLRSTLSLFAGPPARRGGATSACTTPGTGGSSGG